MWCEGGEQCLRGRLGAQVLVIVAFRPIEGVRPFAAPDSRSPLAPLESGCLRSQPKVGGKLHLRLNTGHESDSRQVPRGKVEKNFEERVQ